MKLKLDIELVPYTAWYKNLRNSIAKKEWDKLRKEVYAKYGYRCGICGIQAKINCHELWEYDDKNHIQKLAGFIALCDMCHHVKHLGLAGILSSEGKVDINEVIKHFMDVNNCDRYTFDERRRESNKQFHERSRYNWKLELGEYEKLIDQKKLWQF